MELLSKILFNSHHKVTRISNGTPPIDPFFISLSQIMYCWMFCSMEENTYSKYKIVQGDCSQAVKLSRYNVYDIIAFLHRIA